jgi:hypothetical protein
MYLKNGLVAGIYCVFKCIRSRLLTSGVYVFEGKVEKVYAFQWKVVSRQRAGSEEIAGGL